MMRKALSNPKQLLSPERAELNSGAFNHCRAHHHPSHLLRGKILIVGIPAIGGYGGVRLEFIIIANQV